MLSLIASACSRVSICLHFHSINNYGRFRVANYILAAVIIVASFSVIVGMAFQCHMPSPWLLNSRENCPSRPTIYVFNNILTIIADIALAVLPIALVRKL